MTYPNEDSPPLVHCWSHHPCALVKDMLHVIQHPHLGYHLSWGWELHFRSTNLRFTFAHGWGSGKSWRGSNRGHHHHRIGNATIRNPSSVDGKALRELTDVHREDPWGSSHSH